MNMQDQNNVETRILEAAKRVFVKKGYTQTSMGDVAAEAGIGRTALHYYFRTKEMLFEAILEQLCDMLLPNIRRIVDSKGSILDKVPKIAEEYAKVLQTNMLFPIFIVNELNRDPEHIYRELLKISHRVEPFLILKKQFMEEAEKGIIKKVHPVDALSSLIGLLVFPIIVKNPLTAIFMEGDEERFMKHIMSRTPFVKDMLLYMLTPEKSNAGGQVI